MVRDTPLQWIRRDGNKRVWMKDRVEGGRGQSRQHHPDTHRNVDFNGTLNTVPHCGRKFHGQKGATISFKSMHGT